MSYLAWVDFDPADRKRAQEIISLFKTPEARDELGLAAVRDGLADLLFPATSTIQTRLRYMFFVPWIFQNSVKEKDPVMAARNFEIDLIRALKKGGETTGVIGTDAGESLKRLPSSVYWAALDTLGIRLISGTPAAILANADTYSRPLWHPNLPPQPDGFLETTSFTLRRDEAEFIADRLASEAKDSLFFELSNNMVDLTDVEQAWHLPKKNISRENVALLEHAKRFSFVMHGAHILYNRMLAKRARKNENARVHFESGERLEQYSTQLKNWRDEIPDMKLDDWNLNDMFRQVRATSHNLREPTTEFIERWVGCVIQNKAKGRNAKEFIRRRELQTKGTKKARLHCDAALERWAGASSINQMGFRWNIAKQHLADLKNAE